MTIYHIVIQGRFASVYHKDYGAVCYNGKELQAAIQATPNPFRKNILKTALNMLQNNTKRIGKRS